MARRSGRTGYSAGGSSNPGTGGGGRRGIPDADGIARAAAGVRVAEGLAVRHFAGGVPAVSFSSSSVRRAMRATSAR